MTDFPALLHALSDAGVEYIIVGGVAATIHGSARLTQDLDILYDRTRENLGRLADCLRPHHPYRRGAPAGLPFEWSARTLAAGLNFTLTTALGDINLLGEIVGGGVFADVRPHSISVDLFGRTHLCLDLPSLIRTKRAAGHPRDLEVIAELEALREEGRQGEDASS